MADYKELLRKAVQALPENNGAARRAVYEKARSALVGQLRAINPPLAARDITAHRLQLEDCIRQVEQEASEAVIAGMKESPSLGQDLPTTQPARLEPRPQVRPQPVEVATPAPQTAADEPQSIEDIIAAAEAALPERPTRPVNSHKPPAAARAKSRPVLVPPPEAEPQIEPATETETAAEAIPLFLAKKGKGDAKRDHDAQPAAAPAQEDAAAETSTRQTGKTQRPLPSIVARANAHKTKPPTAMPAFGIPADKPYDGGRRGPTIEPRRDTPAPRLEPAARGAAVARQVAPEPIDLVIPPPELAMSAVREVELEPAVSLDPQSSIDRAIATLDREARGEATETVAEAAPIEVPVARKDRTVPPTVMPVIAEAPELPEPPQKRRQAQPPKKKKEQPPPRTRRLWPAGR